MKIMETQEKKLERCPNCNSFDSIVPSYTLVVTFDNWGKIVSFLAAVVLLGILIDLSHLLILGFAVLSVFPIIVNFAKRQFCVECGVQFKLSDKATLIETDLKKL